MTKKQARAAIAVIKKDATMQGEFCSHDNTKQCVVGGLGKASGVDLKRLKFSTVRQFGSFTEEVMGSALYRKIRRTFGLDLDQLRELERINDSSSCCKLSVRRRRLISKIEQWARKAT